MDVGTGIALFGPSALTLKLLGPTADYVGEGVKSWTELRVSNVQRILNFAERKVDEAELDTPGAVPPRVLKGVLDEGSFIEDDVGTEYFAGVLGGSRTSDGLDDRAVATIALLDGLSTLQIRAHYVLYRAAQHMVAMHGDVNLHAGPESRRIRYITVPTIPFLRAVVPHATDDDPLTGILGHILTGLARHDLIEREWTVGKPEFLDSSVRPADWPDHSLVCTLANFGIELYCAAHGFTDDPLADFKRHPADFDNRWATDVWPCDARAVADLPPKAQSSPAGS